MKQLMRQPGSTARLLAAAVAFSVLPALLAAPADAQTRQPTPQARPAAAAATPAAAPASAPAVQQRCLRALNGACTNAASVEDVRLRAMVIPAAQVSYLGTPAGSIGGSYIPYERFFQDNPQLYGLPTSTIILYGDPTIIPLLPCCVVRTK